MYTFVEQMNFPYVENPTNVSQKKEKFKSKMVDQYELLRTSWRYQTGEFFDNSTLHGVRYIAEKGRPFYERFMWFCFISIGAVATCIIIVSLWEKFQTNPTITGLDTDFHNWNVSFPAITICDTSPNNPDLVDGFINKTWPDVDAMDRSKYEDFLNFLSTLSYKSIKSIGSTYANDIDLVELEDFRAVIFDIVFHCEDFLAECSFKADSENCCELFMPIITEVGFCYAFNTRHVEQTWPWLTRSLDAFSEQLIHETDTKWSLAFDSTHQDALINIYIHAADDMPGTDVPPQHIWDKRVGKISFSVKQTYTTPDARQLSIKQRKCVFADEIKLVNDKIYTYSGCIRQCRMMLARKYCGCVPHFYPQIANFRYCQVVELRCISENTDKITNIDKCNCELGCSNTVYEVEKLTEQEPPKADEGEFDNRPLEVEFVSWPMVRYKREVLFGWVDLLVSFGGIAGLFLGFSFVSGIEIIYYFTLRTFCMLHRNKDELGRTNQEYKEKKAPAFDLGLKIWRKPPTASLKGPRAVLSSKSSANRRRNVVKPRKFIVKEASKVLRPPKFTQPTGYMEYLP